MDFTSRTFYLPRCRHQHSPTIPYLRGCHNPHWKERRIERGVIGIVPTLNVSYLHNHFYNPNFLQGDESDTLDKVNEELLITPATQHTLLTIVYSTSTLSSLALLFFCNKPILKERIRRELWSSSCLPFQARKWTSTGTRGDDGGTLPRINVDEDDGAQWSIRLSARSPAPPHHLQMGLQPEVFLPPFKHRTSAPSQPFANRSKRHWNDKKLSST